MGTPIVGEGTPDGDPVVTPVTDEYEDDNGNTVVVGYPPGSTAGFTDVPGLDPTGGGGPGAGIGNESPGGEGA